MPTLQTASQINARLVHTCNLWYEGSTLSRAAHTAQLGHGRVDVGTSTHHHCRSNHCLRTRCALCSRCQLFWGKVPRWALHRHAQCRIKRCCASTQHTLYSMDPAHHGKYHNKLLLQCHSHLRPNSPQLSAASLTHPCRIVAPKLETTLTVLVTTHSSPDDCDASSPSSNRLATPAFHGKCVSFPTQTAVYWTLQLLLNAWT